MPILKEEIEVVARLSDLGLTRAELLDVVRAAVGGRRNATPFDPFSAGGLFAWIYGTRQLRAIFSPKGWEICRTDNVRIGLQSRDGYEDHLPERRTRR